MDENLLEIKNLKVEYRTDDALVYAINDVSFNLRHGETLGLVGETGAGKTTLALSIMKLLPSKVGFITRGSIMFDGADIVSFHEHKMRQLRGNAVSMIFQDPMTSLNPIFTVGVQIGEVLNVHHKGWSKKEVEKKVDEMLALVGIPPERKTEYPHQFSGGMKQRVVIAIALACQPELLLADEPTTALDVTIQAQVLALMEDLKKKLNTSMILITHDLGVVAETCDRVAIMYAGEIMEMGTLEDIFDSNRIHHPYTTGLFGAIPDLTKSAKRLLPIDGLMPDPTIKQKGCPFYERCKQRRCICEEQKPVETFFKTHMIRCHVEHYENMASEIRESAFIPVNTLDVEHYENMALAIKEEGLSTPLIETKKLQKYFKTSSGWLHAVEDINIKIDKGKTLGVVGESGCGKSTLGRTILRLLEPTDGEVYYNGDNILKYNVTKMRKMRQKMQIIFQDPYASLNPRMTVSEIIAEPIKVCKTITDKKEMDEKISELMKTVGLSERLVNSYPHELDGGRRQRIGVARALAVDPEFIVCDEPVSALDVSIQAQILNLLMDLQDMRKLTYIFITHDLSVVKHISDNIMVMYLGQCVEKTSSKELFRHPIHPYTKALLNAIPIPSIESRNKKRIIIQGEVTSPINPKPGCRFAARCPYASKECMEPLSLREVSLNHFVACAKFNE